MESMKQKKKQIRELSDKEDEKEEEKNTNKNMEDDSKVNKVKMEIQNIDGFLVGSENCRSRFANALLEQGARNVFTTAEKFWNERC